MSESKELGEDGAIEAIAAIRRKIEPCLSGEDLVLVCLALATMFDSAMGQSGGYQLCDGMELQVNEFIVCGINAVAERKVVVQ